MSERKLNVEMAANEFGLMDFQLYQAVKRGKLPCYSWENSERPLHPSQIERKRHETRNQRRERGKAAEYLTTYDSDRSIFETPYDYEGNLVRPHLLGHYDISECLFKEIDLQKLADQNKQPLEGVRIPVKSERVLNKNKFFKSRIPTMKRAKRLICRFLLKN